MAVSSDSPFAQREATVSTQHTRAAMADGDVYSKETHVNGNGHVDDHADNHIEFEGNVDTNNEIPSQATLRKIENFMLLDRDGRAVQFKDLYSGPNVARRVMVIFVRHFYCGYCQEFIRTLSTAIKPDELLHLSIPTFVAVIGCGSPSLIPMYQSATSCPFPIYTDPTQALYSELGMRRTLVLGDRPDYQRRGTMKGMLQSIAQGVAHLPAALGRGKAWEAGDMQQVGGEFMFEPVDVTTPICAPGEKNSNPFDSTSKDKLGVEVEEKRITWCHRMQSTRDHAEIPELREVLGLDGEGLPGKDKKRWDKALRERKGTGLSTKSNGSQESDSGSGRMSQGSQ